MVEYKHNALCHNFTSHYNSVKIAIIAVSWLNIMHGEDWNTQIEQWLSLIE